MKEGAIYTIGYGSRTVEELVTALRSYKVEFVADIRSQPYSSYKPEFSRDNLEKRLKHEGVGYVFMGDTLGGRPNDKSCYVNGKVDYAICRQKSFFQEGIKRLHIALEKGYRVALMCSEGRPEECHRSKLVGAALAEQGVEVRHIDEIMGVPGCSTGYWLPDQPLAKELANNKIYYRYPRKDGVRRLPYVGYAPPTDRIPCGSLVRVSLARWWQHEDSDLEERCYLQLSGWYEA